MLLSILGSAPLSQFFRLTRGNKELAPPFSVLLCRKQLQGRAAVLFLRETRKDSRPVSTSRRGAYECFFLYDVCISGWNCSEAKWQRE
jgi:hypothetical protein